MGPIRHRLLIALNILWFSTAATAALIPRLDGAAIYDSDRDITWLADARYAATEDFGLGGGINGITSEGAMQWETAVGFQGNANPNTWIGRLNGSSYLGFNDWRLPKTQQPDSTCSTSIAEGSAGFNCIGGELGHLIYEELGGVAGTSLSDHHNVNYDLFVNIPIGNAGYWTSDRIGYPNIWAFNLAGLQYTTNRGSFAYVWALRDGDVVSIPEPATSTLLALVIAGLGLYRQKLIKASDRPRSSCQAHFSAVS